MMAFNEDSSGSGHDEPWIQWFCGLKGHEMFCEVERSYIEDGFNLYGLRASVNNFSDCLDLILDRIGPDDSDDSHLTQSAFTLYGLIHARYIVTAHGLDAMYNKYAAKEFGTCPLVQCQGQPVLPLGLKDEVGYDTVEIFCPKCQCVYHPPPPPSKRGGAAAIDGASFGTTFAHLFLMTFSNLVPDPLTPDSTYVPRIFGFRVHSSARQRPATPPLLKGAIHNNNTAATNVVAVSTNHDIPKTTTPPKTETKSPQPQQALEDNKDKWTTLPVVASTISSSTYNTINKSSSGLLLPEVLSNKNGSRNSVGEEGEEEVAEINNGITAIQQQQQEDSDHLEKFPQQTNKKRSRNATDAPENGVNSKLSLKQSKRKKSTNQI